MQKKVYKGDLTYYDLYVQLLDEEARYYPGSADKALYPILRWDTFPMVADGSRVNRYTVTFSPVPFLSVPKTGLPISGALASLDVKCEQVEFELDAPKGSKKIDFASGNPSVKKTLAGS